MTLRKNLSILNEQGMTNGSYVFRGERLWEAVKRSWESMPLETLGRAYMAHHQVVCAILLPK